MRKFILLLGLVWFTVAKADDSPTLPTSNPYQNTEHRYRITFPEGWALVTPNKTFTQVKARAPQGYAVISIACRDSLWRDDTTSPRYQDAWKALDGISITTFTNKFERNPSAESPSIFSVEKVTLGKEKTVKVDYLLKDVTKKISMRIRSFFILRTNRWYSINCATLESHPDLFLDVMLKSAGSFEFYGAKRD